MREKQPPIELLLSEELLGLEYSKLIEAYAFPLEQPDPNDDEITLRGDYPVIAEGPITFDGVRLIRRKVEAVRGILKGAIVSEDTIQLTVDGTPLFDMTYTEGSGFAQPGAFSHEIYAGVYNQEKSTVIAATLLDWVKPALEVAQARVVGSPLPPDLL